MKINYSNRNRVELEEAILGSIMLDFQEDTKALMYSHGYTTPDCFVSPLHQIIYKTILICFENDIKPDLISVSKLKPPEASTFYNFDFLLIQYTQKVSSSAHLHHHLFLLKQYIYADFWLEKADEINQQDWNSTDVVTYSDNVIDSFKALENRFTGNLKKITNQNMSDQMKERWEMVQSGELFTVPFNIKSIDEFTGNGFYPSENRITFGL